MLRQGIPLTLVAVAVFGAAAYWASLPPGVSVADDGCRPLIEGQSITESGRYCVISDLKLKVGVSVDADFVTIDLSGHTILGPMGDTDTVGIRARGSNFRLTNGTIKGFGLGVQIFTDPKELTRGFHQVDRVTITGSSQAGLHLIGR